MLSRCYNKENASFDDYGERGIKVCKQWRGEKGLANFIAWNASLPKKERWKKGLEIDRKNNNKGYSPLNCRWVPRLKNARNKRNTLRVDNGEFKGLAFSEVFDRIGNNVGYITAQIRYRRGWDVIAACTMPPKFNRRIKHGKI